MICGINQSQVPNLPQAQANMSQRQASWIETLQQYSIRIKYKRGIKLKFANTLYHILIRCCADTKVIDSNWTLLVMRNKD